jgi:ribosomal protein S18 acetylase RimI-like enzyme
MARQGLFGEMYYAEGEYLHELKGLAEQTTWRRHWQMGIDGITYPTHSLGPVLQWLGAGDRVARVSCEGSGHHHTDPTGEPYHQDTSVMLCKTVRGALIKIRLDLVSERPHAMNIYQLQGTNGVYESPRAPGEKHRVWLKALSEQVRWHDLDALMNLDELAARYLPDDWRNPPKEALQAGHGGGDYFEVRDWVRAIRGEAPNPLGIHEALDMTLPGLVSQQSIAQNGAWLDVPDSRAWTTEIGFRPQLQMLWPERLLASPPAPNVPNGYRLRLYTDTDEAGYLAVMNKLDFGAWDAARLARARQAVLPGGFFVIEHVATGTIVATAQAGHRPSERHPEGGELGWVAADPEHAGRGLGRAVTAAATRRLIEAGYSRIYLSTEDHRLPALKVYLSLGYEPFLYTDHMAERWQAIRKQLQ